MKTCTNPNCYADARDRFGTRRDDPDSRQYQHNHAGNVKCQRCGAALVESSRTVLPADGGRSRWKRLRDGLKKKMGAA